MDFEQNFFDDFNQIEDPMDPYLLFTDLVNKKSTSNYDPF